MNIGKCSYLAAFLFALSCIIIHLCASEKAPYSTFAKDAKLAKVEEYYDYIIVGGGTSGCALASTLSQGASVLLLERGGLPYGDPHISNIDGFVPTLLNVSPSSPSQPFVSTDGVFNHRARVLGGGTALNGGFYSRASSDYVKKAQWDPRLVNESYHWVESKLVFKPPMGAWQTAVKDGLLEAGVLPDNGFTYDHLTGTKFGGTIFDKNGHRHTAADLLEYADPTKVTVYLYATVEKILFTKGSLQPRASGVNYKDSRGNMHTAYLNGDNPQNDVVLTAGTLGSTQLLMLSGIGPSKQLKAHEIEVVLDQPMVGQGLADNPLNLFFVPSPRPIGTSLAEAVGITNFGSVVEALSAAFGMDSIIRMANGLRDKLGQDFNISNPFISNTSSSPMFDFPINHNSSSLIQLGAIGEKVEGPLSTGTLELKSKNPNENPRVTFNYFQSPNDLERCVKGLEVVLKVITQSQSFSRFTYPFVPPQAYLKLMLSLPLNLRPRHLSAMYSLEQFCVDTVMTIWHYHGGCQVGRVVDDEYRVVGVEGLRVVDSSTFVESPGTNPQATVMMLGRYMGQRILQERTSS